MEIRKEVNKTALHENWGLLYWSRVKKRYNKSLKETVYSIVVFKIDVFFVLLRSYQITKLMSQH